MAKSIPEGYRTITPYLTVKDAPRVIEFYKRAFGAEEMMRIPHPDSASVMHAELKIGDSIVMLSEEAPQMGCFAPVSLKGTTSGLYVYVHDVDTSFKRALDAGAKVTMPLADMFWGDRVGQVEDPAGHRWSLATHREDLSPEEMGKRQREFFASQGQPGGQGQSKK